MMHPSRWIAAALMSWPLLAATVAGAWVVAPELGFGHGIALTAAGDVASAGESYTPAGSTFTVRLQDPVDGSDVWKYQLDGSGPEVGGYNDFAERVAVDAAGNVIAGGSTRNMGTNLDAQVVKLAPNGAPVWTRQVDPASSGDDFLYAMAIGPGGDVAFTGIFGIGSLPNDGYLFSVVRLSGSTGAPLWQHDVPGTPRSRGIGVAFDAAGNVVAFGDVSSGSNSDAVVMKLDAATGNELWRTTLSDANAASDLDDASIAAVDAAGDCYVTGTTQGEGVVVFKLSGATGSVLWRYGHTPADADHSFAQALAVDGGSLYVAADIDGRYTLDKLSAATGTLAWRRKFPRGYYTSIAFDPAGDLIMGGQQVVLFTVQKVRAADGKKRWRRKLRGNKYNGGYVTGVAVDGTGAVFAAGAHVTPLPKGPVNGLLSYTVVRACGANGRINRTDNCP